MRTLVLAFILFIPTILFADTKQCEEDRDLSVNVSSLGDYDQALKKTLCENISRAKNLDDVKKELQAYARLTNYLISKSKAKDRHEVGSALRDCNAHENSRGIVIFFEGTTAYDPRTFYIYNQIRQCLGESELQKFKNSLYTVLYNFSSENHPDYLRWSGLEKGVGIDLATDPELRSFSKDMTFANFPSEEAEVLDNGKLSLTDLHTVPGEVSTFLFGEPKGILAAEACLKNYLKSASNRNIKNPKIIILSHSSGGRTAVKFAEKVKSTNIDLVFTIDPVIEAHRAVQSVLSQGLGNKAKNLLKKIHDNGKENLPPTIWSSKQPKDLYKTKNVKTWVNVYQNEDTKGFNAGYKFGIRGSPIEGADRNIYLNENIGDNGHGAITYNDKTLSSFKKYFLELFK